jgi:hypothetical protein
MFGGDILPADRTAVAAAASILAHAASPSFMRLKSVAIRNVEGKGDRLRRIYFVPNTKFALGEVDGSRLAATGMIAASATRCIRHNI